MGDFQHLSLLLGLLLLNGSNNTSVCAESNYCHLFLFILIIRVGNRDIFQRWEIRRFLYPDWKVWKRWLTVARWWSGWSRWRERRGRRRPRRPRTWSPPVWSTAGRKREEEDKTKLSRGVTCDHRLSVVLKQTQSVSNWFKASLLYLTFV